jgi:hypothetical protein
MTQLPDFDIVCDHGIRGGQLEPVIRYPIGRSKTTGGRTATTYPGSPAGGAIRGGRTGHPL